MSVVEIPLDSEETTEINSESIIENKNIPEEIEENDTKEIEENNIPEKIENNIPEQIEEPPAKKPRGRPKGSTKPKEAAPPKPPKVKRESVTYSHRRRGRLPSSSKRRISTRRRAA